MEKLYDPMYGVGQKEDVNFSRLNTKLYSKISDLMSFLHYLTIETKINNEFLRHPSTNNLQSVKCCI